MLSLASYLTDPIDGLIHDLISSLFILFSGDHGTCCSCVYIGQLVDTGQHVLRTVLCHLLSVKITRIATDLESHQENDLWRMVGFVYHHVTDCHLIAAAAHPRHW